MKTISHSSLVLVRNCLRQYRHSYIDLRRGKSASTALVIGALWDKALNAWHWGKSPVNKLALGDDVLLRSSPGAQRETLRSLLVGYTAKWGEADVETVATQVEFSAPIIHPKTGEHHQEYAFTGIMDGIVRVSGRLLGLESKTSSEDIEPGSTYWQRVSTLDPQVSMYLLGAKSAGHDIEGVLYDVARKPALRLGKTETPEAFGERVARDIQGRPDYYYQRQEIVRLESDARAYQQDLWDYTEILSDAEKLRRWPRNPDRCRQYGRVCEYLPVCVGEASLDDEFLFERKERRKDDTTRQGPDRSAA